MTKPLYYGDLNDATLANTTGTAAYAALFGSPFANGILGIFNVKDFGATGNGTTDDTTAIQAAITAAGGARGGIVFAPAGSYKTSSTLNVPTGVTFLGAGWGTTSQGTIIRPNFSNDVFACLVTGGVGVQGASFLNFTIWPSITPTNGAAFNLQAVNNGRIDSVYVVGGFDGVAIGYAGTNYTNQIYITNCTFGGQVSPLTNRVFHFTGIAGDVYISNIEVTGNSTTTVGAYFDAASYVSPLVMNGVDFESVGYGIYMIPGASISNAVFNEVIVDNARTGYAVRVISGASTGGMGQVQFSNCWFTSTNAVPTVAFTAQYSSSVFGIQMSNCTIEAAGTGAALEFAGGCADFNISGCTIAGGATVAYLVFLLSNLTAVAMKNLNFSGNIIGADYVTGATDGVVLSVSASCTMDRVSLTGCTVSGNGTGLLIANSGTLSNLLVTANNFTGNTTACTISVSLPTTSLITDNLGLNPVGSGTQPGFPLTTVGVANPMPYNATVYVLNGVNTATFKITGVNGNETTAAVPASAFATFRVPANATITPTYAGGAPTWVWAYE